LLISNPFFNLVQQPVGQAS